MHTSTDCSIEKSKKMSKSNNVIAQQVSHWIHDEQACVTVQRVLQTFDLSWEDASDVLKQIPKESHNYSITSFTAKTSASKNGGDGSDDANVFQLVKSKLVADDGDKEKEESAAWYALSLDNCTDSIHTSHEKDRSQFQEEIARLVVPSALRGEAGSRAYSSSILVPEKMKQRIASAGGHRGTTESDFSDHMPSKATFVRPVKKTATTANNFFGDSTKSKASSAKTSKAQGKQPVPSKASSTSMSQSKNTAKATPSSQSSTLSFQPKKKKDTANQPNRVFLLAKNENCDEGKENVMNKSSKKAVGNVDDILGDEESSDDDDDDEMLVEKITANTTKDTTTTTTKGTKAAKSARRAYQMNDATSDNEEQSEGQPVEEEQEKATKKNTDKTDGVPTRRRRKRMVEKTFTDDNGYFYTETQAVWEDVPSDEEGIGALFNKSSTNAINPGKKAKKASAQPKVLKQGSLMGFFKKK